MALLQLGPQPRASQQLLDRLERRIAGEIGREDPALDRRRHPRIGPAVEPARHEHLGREAMADPPARQHYARDQCSILAGREGQ